MELAVVIPAYKPGPELAKVVHGLLNTSIASIVVVDDGSGAEYRSLFDQFTAVERITILRHETNLGKGSALKTGIEHVRETLPTYAGVVTADADGQHPVDDIVRVAERFLQDPLCLVLGSRKFEGDVPWRSRLGNIATRALFALLVGRVLRDTQTGLRAIPRDLFPTLLRIPSSHYEWELAVLIAAKHAGVRIVEEPIKTVYQAGNPTSHFHPLWDSLAVYKVLFRFPWVHLRTAMIDAVVFYFVWYATGMLAAQFIARAVAVTLNYASARNSVFLYDANSRFSKYIWNGFRFAAGSYLLLLLLRNRTGMPVMEAKILSEAVVFVFAYLVQRDWIFCRRGL